MAIATGITLADAQATPVSHTFIPLGPDAKDPTIFWFEDQSQSTPIGYWRMSVQLKRPIAGRAGDSAQGRTVRAVVSMHQPTLETLSNSTMSGITPAPTVAYINRVYTEYVLAERANAQNRKDLRKMHASALSDPQIVNLIENLIPVW